jgi:hypothetical protein
MPPNAHHGHRRHAMVTPRQEPRERRHRHTQDYEERHPLVGLSAGVLGRLAVYHCHRCPFARPHRGFANQCNPRAGVHGGATAIYRKVSGVSAASTSYFRVGRGMSVARRRQTAHPSCGAVRRTRMRHRSSRKRPRRRALRGPRDRWAPQAPARRPPPAVLHPPAPRRGWARRPRRSRRSVGARRSPRDPTARRSAGGRMGTAPGRTTRMGTSARRARPAPRTRERR